MERIINSDVMGFLNIKTNYLKVLGYSLISITALLLTAILIIIVDLMVFGFTTNSAITWETICREYIVNYGSLMIVGGILLYLNIAKYLKAEYKDFKVYAITLLITITVFVYRFLLLGMLF